MINRINIVMLIVSLLLVWSPSKVFTQNPEWWEPVSARLNNGTMVNEKAELVKIFGYIMIVRSTNPIQVYQYYTMPALYLNGDQLPSNTRDMRYLKGTGSMASASSTSARIEIRSGIINIDGASLTYTGGHPEGINLMDGSFSGVCKYKRCESLMAATSAMQETTTAYVTNTNTSSANHPSMNEGIVKLMERNFGLSMNIPKGYECVATSSDVLQIAKRGYQDGDSRILVRKTAPSYIASSNEQKCIRDATTEAKGYLESFDGWCVLKLGSKDAIQYQFFYTDEKNVLSWVPSYFISMLTAPRRCFLLTTDYPPMSSKK